jgi:hypothetical protein
MNDSRHRVAGLWLVAGLLTAPALGAPPASTPAPTTQQRIDRELDGMRGQIRNMKARLENEIAGIAGSGAQAATRPIEVCCSQNLTRIEERAAGMGTILDQLAARFAAQPNRAGIDAVTRIRTDLGTVQQAVGVLRQAPDRSSADNGLVALTQVYIQLRDSADTLETCCGVLPALDDEKAQRSSR